MTSIELESNQFPRIDKPVRARWAPIFLKPIMGSPEQLVIAVVAIAHHDFHVEAANELKRLQCLYGKSAETAIFVAQVAVDELREDLSQRGPEALTEPRKFFSGLEIGHLSEGEGASLEQVARSWMGSLSSLYVPIDPTLVAEKEAVEEEMEVAATIDRLPGLVFDYVVHQRSGLKDFFREDIRDRSRQRRPRRSHDVLIDFAGSRLVANFGTLMVSNRAQSVDKLKRRLWDLKVDRDQQTDIEQRYHELVVQHPRRDDPQISERQADNIEEALQALEQQADKEELRLRPLVNVAMIGDHILKMEAQAKDAN